MLTLPNCICLLIVVCNLLPAVVIGLPVLLKSKQDAMKEMMAIKHLQRQMGIVEDALGKGDQDTTMLEKLKQIKTSTGEMLSKLRAKSASDANNSEAEPLPRVFTHSLHVLQHMLRKSNRQRAEDLKEKIG